MSKSIFLVEQEACDSGCKEAVAAFFDRSDAESLVKRCGEWTIREIPLDQEFQDVFWHSVYTDSHDRRCEHGGTYPPAAVLPDGYSDIVKNKHTGFLRRASARCFARTPEEAKRKASAKYDELMREGQE